MTTGNNYLELSIFYLKTQGTWVILIYVFDSNS